MKAWHGSRKNSGGSALIIALIFLLILTIAGITAMRFSSMEETMAGNSQSRNYVFQQAVSEIYLSLFDFEKNTSARNNLVTAQDKTGKETDANLLKMLPSTHNASIFFDSKLKDVGETVPSQATKKNKLRFISKAPCDDGSSVDKFICLSYEVNVTAAIDNGAASTQTQGFVFKNNKAE